ncbi:quinone-dependent dihydroorotate dehydrogenase [Tepidicaulis sp. LMO-SS28]|uniref:quinone-dependent dihydroorotate dehydrogenase n=1 Tax=Tepidicaulis sp. LMO-SS28 TaxID=3447455 RepID=UPI003EE2A011
MSALYTIASSALRLLEPETAHKLTLTGLRLGLGPRAKAGGDARLATSLFGLDFPNPIGLAAGFDKDGEVPDAMLKAGFGFAEAGTTTPLAQPGNPRPRIFRLPAYGAVINRLGFNNKGHDAMAARLEARKGKPGILGVNIGANKDTEDKAADYVKGIARFEGQADYFTVNISSPNTPGLRALQSRAALEDLITRVLAARKTKTPVLLKIAPDLIDDELADIASVCLKSGIDGIIVSNTTIAREGLVGGPNAGETGGLSGKPLFEPSTKVLARMRELTRGEIPLIGVGGIASGEDAYKKIRAGASLVQLYTAMIYQGPGLVPRIARELSACLARDGYAHVSEAVGADVPVAE